LNRVIADPPLFLAVDGGNSKTDVLLADAAGRVLRRVRGGPFRPQVTGLPAAMATLAGLVDEICDAPVARLSAFLAGADFPVEEAEIAAALEARGWAGEVHAANDTFAVLHAGSSRGWGVAVVCGTGVNCVALAPDGTAARYPAIGEISGDWGGGGDLGRATMFHAVRAEDGRGPATALAAAVVEHFRKTFPAELDGITTVAEVVEAVHFGRVPQRSYIALTRALFETAAAGDALARDLLDRQAAELAGMGLAALRRLGLQDEEVEVVLGGGVVAARDPYLSARLAEAFAPAPRAVLTIVEQPPVVGAAFHALGRLHQDPDTVRAARERLVAELGALPG
jgi:N-acetylglucosamine kinase-like BadF-type ATPase